MWWRTRTALVGLLLLLLLVPVGLLAWEAAEATRSHERVARNLLGDYASAAADAYLAGLKQGWYEVTLTPVYHMQRASEEKVPHLPMRADIHPKKFDYLESAWKLVRSYHRIDGKTGELRTSEPGYDAQERAWLQGLLKREKETLAVPAKRLVVERRAKRTHIYLLASFPGSEECPQPLYALELDTREFHNLLKAVSVHQLLLPPALVDKNAQRELLRIDVRSNKGRVLFTSGRVTGETIASSRTLDDELGGFTVTATLPLAAADRLVIGGLPASRLPAIFALLGLVFALAGAAFWVLRQEALLARLRADFIASVSHELRTPLAQIRMFAETLVLGRVRTKEEARRSLRIIDQEARRLTHQVENVLQFSRTERQELRLQLEPCSPRPLVQEVVDGFRPLATARRVDLDPQLDDVPAVAIDREGFRRVVLNLLDNAVKYGPKDQTIVIGLAQHQSGVRLLVQDEGPGIPSRDRDRIWQKYRRGRDPGAIAGTGIGLFLVRELVTSFGGTVRVTCPPGGGSRFVVDLPIVTSGATS
ncbi:MAG: hypothetical protein CMJ83_20415 [Planctomycetes bacterium]|nr:hypothetical protein [Planctomycetota bacterium]